jgi:hypothetical protein
LLCKILKEDKSKLSIKLSKNMKKVIYALILVLVVVSGLLFANREIKKEPSEKPVAKPLSAEEVDAAKKKWEASPDGILYKAWETSPEGKKILAGADKISKAITDSANMEGVITSLALPPGSNLGFGMMVKINGDDYILSFGPDNSAGTNKEFEQLHSLKENDKIIIRSRNVSFAPKYAYPIIAGDYIEQDSKVIYKRVPVKGGC